jgi:peptide/nickel transport system ATP-binding protein
LPAEPDLILEVENLSKHYPVRRGMFHRTTGFAKAVDDVSFVLRRGETLALVGESGCGKTTTARCIMGAVRSTAGQIRYHDAAGAVHNLAGLGRAGWKDLRKQIQMIFQDPYSSLDPRMSLLDIIGEPLLVHGVRNRGERTDRVAELLRLVGLRPEYMRRFPHAFSGGQRQRIGIARALALNPRLVVADEAVSALDVSVQAQILNLMLDLQEQLGLTYLFVSHDLSVVRHISDRILVMHAGKIVEAGETEAIFAHQQHPYTAALLAAVPKLEPSRRAHPAGAPSPP